MAKAELGLKRTCVECNSRFYDLNRVPPVCPKCGAIQPANNSRLKNREDELEDNKENVLIQNEHENDLDVDIDTDDEADDDVMTDDDLDDDISSDIEVTTDNDERDDN
ncbi:TIGR02300 family protein [Acetobacteraceae bacterium ESL0709]|nr:TIGR02300 family protein [Acetobacteraceae bacterium ESL0697]MDF7677283.1 TIGR02300 family protein [Acetobacteraceae bacterium ESL0709]